MPSGRPPAPNPPCLLPYAKTFVRNGIFWLQNELQAYRIARYHLFVRERRFLRRSATYALDITPKQVKYFKQRDCARSPLQLAVRKIGVAIYLLQMYFLNVFIVISTP